LKLEKIQIFIEFEFLIIILLHFLTYFSFLGSLVLPLTKQLQLFLLSPVALKFGTNTLKYHQHSLRHLNYQILRNSSVLRTELLVIALKRTHILLQPLNELYKPNPIRVSSKTMSQYHFQTHKTHLFHSRPTLMQPNLDLTIINHIIAHYQEPQQVFIFSKFNQAWLVLDSNPHACIEFSHQLWQLQANSWSNLWTFSTGQCYIFSYIHHKIHKVCL